MSLLYQSNTFVKVNRRDTLLRAECTLLSNNIEAVAWIDAEVSSLKIQRAGWAQYRSSYSLQGVFDLPELIGAEAYITGGPALKKHLGAPEQELPRELIAECFRGVLQAETFFFMERGYESAKEYDDCCEQYSIDACRYYTHLDEVDKQWTEWVETTERNHNLFNRSKTVNVQKTAPGFAITAVFLDSFHHLGVSLELDDGGVVQKIDGNYLCAPDKICFANREHLVKLIGSQLVDITKKELAVLAGGAEGCNHLVDLLYEVVKVMNQL